MVIVINVINIINVILTAGGAMTTEPIDGVLHGLHMYFHRGGGLFNKRGSEGLE